MIENLVKEVKSRFSSLGREIVADEENIKLIEIHLPDSINGVYYCQNNINIIALKKELNEFQKQEIFWHEFYHYMFSVGNFFLNNFEKSEISNIDRREENRADLFVALLLIGLISEGDTIESIAEKWNVSESIAKLRIEYEYSKHNQPSFQII